MTSAFCYRCFKISSFVTALSSRNWLPILTRADKVVWRRWHQEGRPRRARDTGSRTRRSPLGARNYLLFLTWPFWPPEEAEGSECRGAGSKTEPWPSASAFGVCDGGRRRHSPSLAAECLWGAGGLAIPPRPGQPEGTLPVVPPVLLWCWFYVKYSLGLSSVYNRAGAHTEYTDVMLTKLLHGAGSSPASLSDVREYLPEFCLG